MPRPAVVVLLSLIPNWLRSFGLTCVRTNVALLGLGISELVIYAKLANNLAGLVGHEDENAVDKTAGSTGMVTDGLDGGGNDFEVVISLQEVVHLWLIPEALEQGADQSKTASK